MVRTHPTLPGRVALTRHVWGGRSGVLEQLELRVIVVATLHVRAEAERADMSARRLAGACAGRGERETCHGTLPTGVAAPFYNPRYRRPARARRRFGADSRFSVRSARRRGFDTRLRAHRGVKRPRGLPQRTRQASYGRGKRLYRREPPRGGSAATPGGVLRNESRRISHTIFGKCSLFRPK